MTKCEVCHKFAEPDPKTRGTEQEGFSECTCEEGPTVNGHLVEFETLEIKPFAYGLQNIYEPDEMKFLRKEFKSFWEINEGSFEFVDNERLARVGNLTEEFEFDERARQGCCGSHNVVFGPSPGGHHYRYGFNHGH